MNGKCDYVIGALLRRSFRRACMKLDIEYKEDKGWMDSYFIVKGEVNKVKQLNNWVISNQ